MPFIEIQRFASGVGFNFQALNEGSTIQGKIGERQVQIAVEDGTLILNNVILANPVVLLDPEGRIVKEDRLLIEINQEEISDLLRRKARADIPLFGGRDQTELAEVLGKLYSRKIRAIEGGEPPEALLHRIGQWLIAILISP